MSEILLQPGIDKLQLVLNELENATGKKLQFTVHALGYQNSQIIGDFNKRLHDIKVEMISDYDLLNGKYSSLDAIRKRINSLWMNDIMFDYKTIKDRKVGKCRECKTYGNEEPGFCLNYLEERMDLCQNCGYDFKKSKWYTVKVPNYETEIYSISDNSKLTSIGSIYYFK